MRLWPGVLLCLLCAWASGAQAATVRAATASNFVVTLQALSAAFEEETGHSIEVLAGSTGTLFAQIKQGAPFDMFLAADTKRPELLEGDGLIAPGSRATYARGQLALLVPGSDLRPQRGQSQVVSLLRANPRWRIAIANPQLAPYGLAAQQVLQRLGGSMTRLAYGQNVAQAYALVRSGNAQAGLVAWSQIYRLPAQGTWPIPASLHDPIDQDMVILKRAARNRAAKALHAFLLSDKTVNVLRATGYAPVKDTPVPLKNTPLKKTAAH